MVKAKNFSALTISKISKPGFHRDGATRGLYMQVANKVAGGITKSFVYRFVSPVTGKPRWMGLGPADAILLADARELAGEARRLVKLKRDPIEERRAEAEAKKDDAAKRKTFKECAEQYIIAKAPSWANKKHADQWRSTLKTYAYPVIGTLPVATVDLPHILKILEPIWHTKTETATRVRMRIENVLDWARVRKFRSGDNPARWKGHLETLLTEPSKTKVVRHHAALPYDEIPKFMAELRSRDSVSARALEFTILTAARTGATIGAKWDEIKSQEKVWTVPAEREGTKMKKDHRVPLSDRLLEILKKMPREGEFIFPGGKKNEPLSNAAMDQLLKGMGYNSGRATVHGFRSVFKDWAAETTNYPNILSEAALGHVVADKVEAAYRRGELFEKRGRMMRDWARYCGQKPKEKSATDNVTTLHGRA
jgi:integrase